MNWRKWLTYNPYKKLWSLVGGRPWTYIYRDAWHKVEILMQAQWFWTAVLVLWLMDVSIPLEKILVGWAIYTLGYIMGHFFWGTKYIPGQEGNGG